MQHKGISIIVACFLAGLLAGGLGVYFMVGMKFPPANHAKVVEAITITDLTRGYTFNMICTWSGNVKYLSLQPYLGLTPGETYPRSEWVGRQGNDLDVVMSIWGPTSGGNDYNVEVAKLAGNQIVIAWSDSMGGGEHILPEGVGGTPSVGYVAFWFYL